RTKHFYQLSESYFKKAIEKEKSDKLSEAIQQYNTAKDYAEKSDNKAVQYNSVARIEICKLKSLSIQFI
ncbi:MAG TPA: hypothetical protein PK007_10855, partial [Candidatus Kapabacteria bacterium]|nr:hypothetical protein [Candidatus Kapabacteria bacterium]